MRHEKWKNAVMEPIHSVEFCLFKNIFYGLTDFRSYDININQSVCDLITAGRETSDDFVLVLLLSLYLSNKQLFSQMLRTQLTDSNYASVAWQQAGTCLAKSSPKKRKGREIHLALFGFNKSPTNLTDKQKAQTNGADSGGD